MPGRKERGQPELFITGPPRDVVPDDHVLVRVDHVVDLRWLPSEVADSTKSGKWYRVDRRDCACCALKGQWVPLGALQQGMDTSTPAGQAMLQMSGVFAQFERSMIVERTKAGMARARARGAQIGPAGRRGGGRDPQPSRAGSFDGPDCP